MTKKYLLISLGWVSIVLGVLGIFLPVLPTTPFILLAAWAFSRSSTRFYCWLLAQPQLGPMVIAWQNNTGIPRHIRNRVIILLWFSLISSAFIMGLMGYGLQYPLLTLVGIGVTIYLLRQPLLDE